MKSGGIRARFPVIRTWFFDEFLLFADWRFSPYSSRVHPSARLQGNQMPAFWRSFVARGDIIKTRIAFAQYWCTNTRPSVNMNLAKRFSAV